jgi:hypothetical protein
VFNAGKDIEAMKRLMLHRIASSLYHFIASIAQLCQLPLEHPPPTLEYARGGSRTHYSFTEQIMMAYRSKLLLNQ